MSFPRLPSWFLIALTAVTVLGHICALPFHAHAGAVTTHEEHQSHHGGEAPDEEAAHAGSCDVVKSAPPAFDGVALVPAAIAPTITAKPAPHPVDADPAVAIAFPPLFLLHAALLI